MKKILLFILAAVMVLSCVALTGCGDKEDSFKVGAIYITSQNDTAGYTFAHHNGIKTAVTNLGISSEDFVIIDNIPDDDYTAVSNAIDTLAGQGCDIIFGISFGYITAFDDAAKKEEYKDIIFSHGTGYLSSLSDWNLKEGEQYFAQFNNYFGRIYQARYLSGIAAGFKSLELGNNNLGYVAAWGTEYAETCSGINAFTLGAQSVNPNAVVHVKEISTWGNEALEKQAAEVLIDTYNCCVIAQHCDSAQPQLVAANKNVFGCGYNSDMSIQAPSAHLTAPIWNWDVYYELAIKTARDNSADYMTTVGNYYGGLKEKFVDISALSANCSAGTADVVALVKAMLESGEWDVFSGTKLSYTKDANGAYSVVKTSSALLTNTDEVVVEAGGASVEDGVITGSMNYYVKGVIDEK